MITGIILLILGIFLIAISILATMAYDTDDDDRSNKAETIIILFVIGAFLMLGGGVKIDNYISPPEMEQTEER